METLRQTGQLVTVTHPDLHVILKTSEQPVDMTLVVESLRVQVGVAVLTRDTSHDIILAQAIGQLLLAVADTEDGDPEVQEGGIHVRRAFLIDTVGATGENDTLGLEVKIGQLLGTREHLTVHIELTETARDQVSLQSR